MGSYPAKQRWVDDYRDSLLAVIGPLLASGMVLNDAETVADTVATRAANLMRMKRQELGID